MLQERTEAFEEEKSPISKEAISGYKGDNTIVNYYLKIREAGFRYKGDNRDELFKRFIPVFDSSFIVRGKKKIPKLVVGYRWVCRECGSHAVDTERFCKDTGEFITTNVFCRLGCEQSWSLRRNPQSRPN